jgi:hypothetical protein
MCKRGATDRWWEYTVSDELMLRFQEGEPAKQHAHLWMEVLSVLRIAAQRGSNGCEGEETADD